MKCQQPSSIISFISTLFLLLTFSQPASTAEQQTLTGLFTIIWGDNFSANIPPSELYFLTSEAGTTSELLIDSSVARVAGGLLSLNGKVVSVSVPINPLQHKIATSAPLVVNRVYTEQDLYEVDDFAMSPQAVTGSQPWVTVMCKFQDIADEPQNLSYFQNMYSSSYPGLDHYWQEASYNIVNISGSSATGWYTLPQPRSYYVYQA